MKLFILTKCVSGRSKCSPSSQIYPSQALAGEALEAGVWEGVKECADKYEISTGSIEPKNNQGAKIFRIYDDTYAWKIKTVEIGLNPGDTACVLLHAHNGGYVAYAEARVFPDMEKAREAMRASFEEAQEMWRLMKGKSLYRSVESSIAEDRASLCHEDDVETWAIEQHPIPAQS